MSTVSGNDPPLATSALFSNQLSNSPQPYPICITNSVNIGPLTERGPSQDMVETEPTSPVTGVKLDSHAPSAMFENLEAVGLIPKSIQNGIGNSMDSLKEMKLLQSSSKATVDIATSPAFTSTVTLKPVVIVDEGSQTDGQSSCQTDPGESGCLDFVAAEFKKIHRRLDDLQTQLSSVKEAVISVENHVLGCSISPQFHSRSATRPSDSPLTQPGVVNCRLTEVATPFKNSDSNTSNADTPSSKPCQADKSHVFSCHSGPAASSSGDGSTAGEREAPVDTVPTEGNPSRNPADSIDLDPARIAAAVRKTLNRWGIGQRIFAQRVLNLSQGTVSELLSKPKSWSRLTEKGRSSYRRMAEWLNNPDSVRELRKFVQQEASDQVYLPPPISRWWAKRRLTTRTISSHGSPSTLATPLRSLRSRKPYGSKISIRDDSIKTGISSNGPESVESDSESGESTDTQARIANLLLNARLAMASAKVSPVPNSSGKAEVHVENISARCGDGLPTVGDSGNSNSASSSEVTTVSELPPRPVSLNGSHSQPDFTSSPSSGLSVSSQHLIPPVCPVGMFGPPAASAISCLPNFSPNHISVHFSSPLTCVSPNRASEEHLDPITSSLLGGPSPSSGGPLLPTHDLASDTTVAMTTMPNPSAPSDGETEVGPTGKPGSVYDVPSQSSPGDLCLSLPSREAIASMGPLNTAEIAQRTKETLQRYSISQRAFGLRVLGLSQGSVSDLLTRPKPWKTLTHKGREPYIRMHLFLENPSLLSKEGPSPISSFLTPSVAESKVTPEQSVIATETGSDRTPPLKHVLNLFNEPLRHAVDINSEEGLSMMMNGLEIPPLVVEVKEALTARNMSQRVFGNTVLGLTQASVSDLLSKIRPWNQLTVRGRESYVRMRLWLDSLKKTSSESGLTADLNGNHSVGTRSHPDASPDKQPAAKRARRPVPVSGAGTTSISRSSSGNSSLHSEAAPLTATVLTPSVRQQTPVAICKIPEPDPPTVARLPAPAAVVPLTSFQVHRTSLSAANAVVDSLATAAVYCAPAQTVTRLPTQERSSDSEVVNMLAVNTKSEEVTSFCLNPLAASVCLIATKLYEVCFLPLVHNLCPFVGCHSFLLSVNGSRISG
uniref:CUT domain-containing protein n=1 Tax=Schistocephalus solidus TaxID=70667 RepID=A0A0X3NK60_SCHSO